MSGQPDRRVSDDQLAADLARLVSFYPAFLSREAQAMYLRELQQARAALLVAEQLAVACRHLSRDQASLALAAWDKAKP